MARQHKSPVVGVVMGSVSDWGALKGGVALLEDFEVPCESLVVSAHRTPERLYEYAKTAGGRGLKVIIAAAGGAAHLPGMIAALTLLPVFGVPVGGGSLHGQDSLLSIVQMPDGVPVGTLAIGAGRNAALLAVRVLALEDAALASRLAAWQERQREAVPHTPE